MDEVIPVIRESLGYGVPQLQLLTPHTHGYNTLLHLSFFLSTLLRSTVAWVQ
jgi:hypothetical protein